MSLIHDIIKIKYVDEGYLPYYPYHLISDEEMFDAFINNDVNFFDDMYPEPCISLSTEYKTLRSFISFTIKSYMDKDIETIPDWIYTYMLGEVVNQDSEQKDKHDLFVLLDVDNLEDEFNDSIYELIYKVSRKQLGKRSTDSTDADYRPCTMFGEPHIFKYLRLEQVSV